MLLGIKVCRGLHNLLMLLCLQNGAEDVMRHKWFKGVDWEEVITKKLQVRDTENEQLM